MKANAPEKIYLVIDPVWGSMSVNYNRNDTDNIEYTRTDAFIEKAKKWFEEHFMNRLKWEIATYEFEDIQSMVEDFRNYMKGE